MITKKQPSPLLTLWYKPGTSMRGLLDAGQGHGVAIMIAAFFGAVQSGRFELQQESSGPMLYLVGALGGICGLYLFGWLMRNFGRWFGADVAQRDVRTALGISLLPWTLLFVALSFMLGVEQDAEAIAAYYPLFFIVFVYGYVIMLLSLTAALRIGVVKSFLCLVVTGLVSLFPLTLLAQFIVKLFGGNV